MKGVIWIMIMTVFGLAQQCPVAPVAMTGASDGTQYYSYNYGGSENLHDDTWYILGRHVVGQSDVIVNNNNGTLTDQLTGLMWTQDADMLKENGGEGNVSKALQVCTEAVTGGYNDWRLPNIRELHSLVNFGNIATTFRSAYQFINTGYDGYYYWTSTPKRDIYSFNYGLYYWMVDMIHGTTNYKHYKNKYHVICVRNDTSNCENDSTSFVVIPVLKSK